MREGAGDADTLKLAIVAVAAEDALTLDNADAVREDAAELHDDNDGSRDKLGEWLLLARVVGEWESRADTDARADCDPDPEMLGLRDTAADFEALRDTDGDLENDDDGVGDRDVRGESDARAGDCDSWELDEAVGLAAELAVGICVTLPDSDTVPLRAGDALTPPLLEARGECVGVPEDKSVAEFTPVVLTHVDALGEAEDDAHTLEVGVKGRVADAGIDTVVQPVGVDDGDATADAEIVGVCGTDALLEREGERLERKLCEVPALFDALVEPEKDGRGVTDNVAKLGKALRDTLVDDESDGEDDALRELRDEAVPDIDTLAHKLVRALRLAEGERDGERVALPLREPLREGDVVAVEERLREPEAVADVEGVGGAEYELLREAVPQREGRDDADGLFDPLRDALGLLDEDVDAEEHRERSDVGDSVSSREPLRVADSRELALGLCEDEPDPLAERVAEGEREGLGDDDEVREVVAHELDDKELDMHADTERDTDEHMLPLDEPLDDRDADVLRDTRFEAVGREDSETATDTVSVEVEIDEAAADVVGAGVAVCGGAAVGTEEADADIETDEDDEGEGDTNAELEAERVGENERTELADRARDLLDESVFDAGGDCVACMVDEAEDVTQVLGEALGDMPLEPAGDCDRAGVDDWHAVGEGVLLNALDADPHTVAVAHDVAAPEAVCCEGDGLEDWHRDTPPDSDGVAVMASDALAAAEARDDKLEPRETDTDAVRVSALGEGMPVAVRQREAVVRGDVEGDGEALGEGERLGGEVVDADAREEADTDGGVDAVTDEDGLLKPEGD